MTQINISNFLRVLYFVAAVCIVAIHSPTLHTVVVPARWNVTLHRIVCNYLTFWAVPFFFLCSGFFFARGKYVREGGYRAFLSGKVKSVLVPYFAWSVIAAVVLVPLVVANNWYTHHPLIERTFFSDGNALQCVGSLFGIGVYGGPRHNGPLWFLRSLMVLFLFAPLWRLLARHWWGLLVFVAGFVVVKMGYSPQIIYGYDWEYFFLGIVLGRCVPVKFVNGEGRYFAHIPHFVYLSFWLYCTHNIILGYLLSSGHFVFGKGNVAIACLTVSAIPLTVLISLSLAKLMGLLFPCCFAILNGGRST